MKYKKYESLSSYLLDEEGNVFNLDGTVVEMITKKLSGYIHKTETFYKLKTDEVVNKVCIWRRFSSEDIVKLYNHPKSVKADVWIEEAGEVTKEQFDRLSKHSSCSGIVNTGVLPVECSLSFVNPVKSIRVTKKKPVKKAKKKIGKVKTISKEKLPSGSTITVKGANEIKGKSGSVKKIGKGVQVNNDLPPVGYIDPKDDVMNKINELRSVAALTEGLPDEERLEALKNVKFEGSVANKISELSAIAHEKGYVQPIAVIKEGMPREEVLALMEQHNLSFPAYVVNGIPYPSARKASAFLNISVNTVLKRCKSNKDGYFYIEK